MNRNFLITFISVVILTCSCKNSTNSNSKIPSNGKPVLADNNSVPMSPEMEQYGKHEVIEIENQHFSQVIRATTLKKPKQSKDLKLSFPLAAPIQKGDVLLLSFWARTIETVLNNGLGMTRCVLKKDAEMWGILYYEVQITKEWKRYFIPFISEDDFNKEDSYLHFHLGYSEQKLEFANIQLINYTNNVNIADLPTTEITYPGRESEAKWRAEADARIEKIRKGDIKIKLIDKDGNAIENAQVSIEMKKHLYGFGSAVDASTFLNNEKYRNTCYELFNEVVLENDLKMARWLKPESRKKTFEVLNMLNDKGIRVRGHTLVWPGFNWMPKFVKEEYGNKPEALHNFMNEHVKEEVSLCKGKVIDWDVINEAYAYKDLENAIGTENIYYEYFEIARKNDPNVKLFINDYDILSTAGVDFDHQDWYYNFVKQIDEHTGNLVDGIGMQSHFGQFITPPERILEILDKFAELNKTIKVTEFDINVSDEQLQADFTRDFYTAVFSHPATSAILTWGFWEGKHWKPEAAMFKDNWETRKNGEIFKDLVFNKWQTRENGKTDNDGIFTARGFLGSYAYKIVSGDNTISGEFSIDNNKKENKIVITLENF